MDCYLAASIQPSPLCYRLESEWCWAEANEFGLQKQELNFEENLTRESSYYEVVLLPYLEQDTWKEYLLNPLEILLFDAITESTTIKKCLNVVSAQIIQHQPQIDVKEIEEQLLSRIRFFSYFGLLTIQINANVSQENNSNVEKNITF